MHLVRLRAAYNRTALLSLGETFLTDPYPPMGPWASFLMHDVYADVPLNHQARELILVALLTSRKQPGTMAVHMYWALMEGATPEAIAHTIMLTGCYTGIDTYTIGIRTLHKLLTQLSKLSDEGTTDTAAIMRHLVQLFPA